MADGMKSARSVVRSAADKGEKDLNEMTSIKSRPVRKGVGSAAEVGALQYYSSASLNPHPSAAGECMCARMGLPPALCRGKASHSCTLDHYQAWSNNYVYLLTSSLTVVLDSFTCALSPLLIRDTIFPSTWPLNSDTVVDYTHSRCVKQAMSTLYAALPPLVSRPFSSSNDLRSECSCAHVAISSRDAYTKYTPKS